MKKIIEWLSELKTGQQITSLDYHLALFFTEQSGLTDFSQQQQLAFLILWLNRETRSGHVCIDLTAIDEATINYQFDMPFAYRIWQDIQKPQFEDWLTLIKAIKNKVIGFDGGAFPLILQSKRLYFQRMWFNEKRVAGFFLNNQSQPFDNGSGVRQLLDLLFAEDHDHHQEIDWQKIAAAIAISNRITIISGGPGTGKTTTVSKILAALIAIHHQKGNQSPLRIVAAAPTGKAAARLTESLSFAAATLAIEQKIKDNLPIEAVTLHRLLGAKLNSHHYFYNKNNLLNVDLLLIDEASMIDLSMMVSIIEALPEKARLILLGDKEQLSSVEAGAVFGDLCELIDKGYSDKQINNIHQLTGYQLPYQNNKTTSADNICLLQKSYRFTHQSGIGKLADAVKNGQREEVIRLLSDGSFHDICHYKLLEYNQAITLCVNSYRIYLQAIKLNAGNIKAILSSFAEFRLLCALREGDFGVKGLNRLIENSLAQQNDIELKSNDAWYVGRPVMILKNSFSLGLFNGDIGITLPSPEDNSKLKVYFLMPNGEVKGVSPFRLPEHETAYAMTIHKSQGSEFNRVAIILPNEYSPLLTRSLLYTAITRAKQHATIYAEPYILDKTLNSQSKRKSGLVDLIKSRQDNAN